MSVGRARVAGVVGVAGLLLTLLAGVLETSPGLAATAAWAAELFIFVSFRIAAVAVFCLGFAVIVYSAYHQRRGSVDEATARRISFGVAGVLVLSLFFPLVVLDDLAVLAGGVLRRAGVDPDGITVFYASLAVFGSLTLVGLVDAVRRRRG
ncbi:hypothetical protein [Halorientalis regularis]|jgi:hypothetical protein|uniref:Uncharacterized protein n=1 Tax=Halorientalis regularis TaxID=660518 RepID=A0A1G7IXL3_9EURY|nr:hypothetical protein [Halorientalis regularis]SDF17355.1 hypothetical protein SAMN05216218_104121 [Halorientalis regularis]